MDAILWLADVFSSAHAPYLQVMWRPMRYSLLPTDECTCAELLGTNKYYVQADNAVMSVWMLSERRMSELQQIRFQLG